MSNQTSYENDLLYDDLKDLVNDQFKAWYMKCFYKLGRKRVLELAGEAMADGKESKKLFSYLLKKETTKTYY